MQDGNYIKLNRKILDWEWFENKNAFRLFVYMLLKANWKENNFRGTIVQRGSFASSISKISAETGLTVMEVRTLIKKLETTGELTIKTQTKYSVFTINKYDEYQGINTQDNNQITNNQQSNNNQITNNQQSNNNQITNNQQSNNKQSTTIEEKKEREEKKEVSKKNKAKKIAAPPVSYFPLDQKLNQAFIDFLEMRKKLKNGAMTDRAVSMMINKLQKQDSDTAVAMLEQSILNNWKDVYPVKGQETAGGDKATRAPTKNKFTNFEQRNYSTADMQSIEQRLLKVTPDARKKEVDL